MLLCLGDPIYSVRSAAASATSAIALIEIPIGLWDDLFDYLGSRIQDQNTSLEEKCACVLTIRYICEDFAYLSLDSQMVSKLMYFLLGCLEVQQPPQLIDEAIQALSNALILADEYMHNSDQCTQVMMAVLNSCQNANHEIQAHAFQCLTTVFGSFYDLLEPYFMVFYEVCEIAIKSAVSNIAVQACFVICTLAEEEKERIMMSRPVFNFIAKCYVKLASVLCDVMTTQEEEDDGEMVTAPIAAATCLSAVAEVMKNGR